MDGARFDRLAVTWAHRHSRRGVLSLLSALALGGFGQGPGAVAAKMAGAAGAGCQGGCAQGQRCKHGACVDRCNNPGTCSGGGSGGGPPACGAAGANCACVATRKGRGFCLAASQSTSENDGCISKGCQRNGDCAKGQVCAHVPGCCVDKPRICAIPCPQTTCVGFRQPCSSPDECCAADQTSCAPITAVGDPVCCRPLGGACTSGGIGGDCCFVPVTNGSDAPGCSPGGTCGGTGAACRFNGQCVSGTCTGGACT
jgi:hypothetical protein